MSQGCMQVGSRHHHSVGPGVPQSECGTEECDTGNHGAGLHVCSLLAPHCCHLRHHSCHPGHLQAVRPVLQVSHLLFVVTVLLNAYSLAVSNDVLVAQVLSYTSPVSAVIAYCKHQHQACLLRQCVHCCLHAALVDHVKQT